VISIILVDNSEPQDIIALLRQSAPVSIMPLNQTHRSDYYFGGEDGKTRQFSRKQAGELLGNIDEAESQIRDYYENADVNYQLVEGIISDVPLTKRRLTPNRTVSIRGKAQPNTLFSYKIADSGFIYDEHAWNISASLYHAWIFRLAEAGVVTLYSINYVDTAKMLAAIYKNCQKPEEEHTTLQRYIRPRIVIRSHDPFIEALMSISLAYKIGIGEEKATKLSEYYHSLLDVAMSSVDELCRIEGIGKTIASKLMAAMGREESDE